MFRKTHYLSCATGCYSVNLVFSSLKQVMCFDGEGRACASQHESEQESEISRESKREQET